MNNQRFVILLLLIAYIFAPTIFTWVINPAGAWYRPFIAWACIIIIAFVVQRQKKSS